MDRTQARDYINTAAKVAFAEATTQVLGAPGEMRYQGIAPVEGMPLVPQNDTYWARVTMRIVAEPQETLRCEVRRFMTVGNVIIQMFFPTLDPNAQPNLDKIAELMRNRFRTQPSEEIEFTGSRVDDNIPAEPNWLRANLVSQFTYRQFI